MFFKPNPLAFYITCVKLHNENYNKELLLTFSSGSKAPNRGIWHKEVREKFLEEVICKLRVVGWIENI